MIYGLWLSAAGLQVNEHRQAVLANNLANVETTGFKQDLVVLRERATESKTWAGSMGLTHPVLDRLGGGTFVGPSYTDFSQGSISQSDNPLDVAIVGSGFFTIEAGGRRYYTRDGAFSLDSQGRLVTARGELVLDDQGQPINLPNGAAARIDESGRVWADKAVVGRLGLVDFADPHRLVKVGQNRFDGRFAQPAAFGGQLRVGALENSTVGAIENLARFIEASRAYQLNAQMISLQDGMLGRAVNDIARL